MIIAAVTASMMMITTRIGMIIRVAESSRLSIPTFAFDTTNSVDRFVIGDPVVVSGGIVVVVGLSTLYVMTV